VLNIKQGFLRGKINRNMDRRFSFFDLEKRLENAHSKTVNVHYQQFS
jgi:hypothetical protein